MERRGKGADTGSVRLAELNRVSGPNMCLKMNVSVQSRFLGKALLLHLSLFSCWELMKYPGKLLHFKYDPPTFQKTCQQLKSRSQPETNRGAHLVLFLNFLARNQVLPYKV